MAIIPQTRLFSWQDVENLGELKRLELVLKSVPDEALMRTLEAERANGRDDYPLRAVWNSILAGIVYQHACIESLRRELLRNDRLRWMCGFDPLKKATEAVPPPWVYTRFLRKLMAHQREIDGMFDTLVEKLRGELEGFGRHLACDSKGIRTHARPRGKEAQQSLESDGRRDIDADFGKKTYLDEREEGTLWKRVKSWFGYKLHLIVDGDYELPVAYEVTRASRPDNESAVRMLGHLEDRHRELVDGCEALMGDKAYDDGKLLGRLWQDYGIKPVIPIRDCWQDGEQTRLLAGTRNIVYDYQGQIYCYCMRTGKRQKMVYWGFEHKRDMQKWRCPAAVWGYECKDWERCCGNSGYGRIVRVDRKVAPRIFTPLARPSLAFERLYKKRTAAERVNSRLDVSFGFERHFIRGQNKMQLRCSVALVVMLAMALGRVKEKQKEKLRSLVAAA